MRKDRAYHKETRRRRTVCTPRSVDAVRGAGFPQRYPEFKWLLVLVYHKTAGISISFGRDHLLSCSATIDIGQKGEKTVER